MASSKPRSRDLEKVVGVLQAAAAAGGAGLAALEQARNAQVEQQRVKQERAYRKAVRRYERAIARWRGEVVAGSAGGGAALITLFATGQPLWLAGTAAGGALAAMGWSRLRTATPPTQPVLPPPPLPVLPAGAPGAASVARLARAQRHLTEVAPAVERLHPGAGKELRQAADAALPLLQNQAQRLVVLVRVRHDMAGTPAAQAAEVSAREVEVRMERGAEAFEGLLTAAATLLGAPDLDDSAERVLAQAVEGLLAATAGLQAADAARGE